MMARRTMAITPMMTNTEMKMPFQSRDLVGIETSSWKSAALVKNQDDLWDFREQITTVLFPLFLRKT